MFKRKDTKQQQGYILKSPDSALMLMIDGREYTAYVDTPEFLAWWKENQARFSEKGFDPERIIRLVCDFIVALLGAKAAQDIFNGKPRSIMQYAGLLEYVFEEMSRQGIDKKLRANRKYSSCKII